MRVRRSYRAGLGVTQERVSGEELIPRRRPFDYRGRIGDMWFDPKRNRVEARGVDGQVIGIELPKGN